MTDGKKNWDEATLAARAGIEEEHIYGSITPPVYMSSNFAFPADGSKGPYNYTRSGNPTRDMLGKALAQIEGGHHAVVTSTGMSALDLAFQLLGKDDLLIAPYDCYGGTHRLLTARAKQAHYRVKFADMTHGADLDKAFAEKAAMVLIETPSNPLMRLTDIEAVAKRAKAQGAIVVVDNTFLPVLQKPFGLGADVVVHSTTKYLNGHGDVVGGALVSKTPELHEKYTWWANCIGLTGAPFDSFLTLRGLRTLMLRIEQQTKTAGGIATFLAKHPAIKKVYYPGLPDHPGREIAVKQQKGFGAMLSFDLKGDLATTRAFMAALCSGEDHLFSLAASLGGYESLAVHPATMTHAGMTPEARAEAGVGDTLMRLSIGLESEKDLTAALKQALDRLL